MEMIDMVDLLFTTPLVVGFSTAALLLTAAVLVPLFRSLALLTLAKVVLVIYAGGGAAAVLAQARMLPQIVSADTSFYIGTALGLLSAGLCMMIRKRWRARQ
jgi:hypothetical protein